MEIVQKHMNLLSVSKDYAIVHCINAAFRLGAGVAKQINESWHVGQELKNLYRDYNFDNAVLFALPTFCSDRLIISLVTKKYHWHKPTYDSLYRALLSLRTYVKLHDIKKIAMPKIGCGLDRLSWDRVLPIIKYVFNEEDIEILVCVL